jgi:hypothetical protein
MRTNYLTIIAALAITILISACGGAARDAQQDGDPEPQPQPTPEDIAKAKALIVDSAQPVYSELDTAYADNGNGIAAWLINNGTGLSLLAATYDAATAQWSEQQLVARFPVVPESMTLDVGDKAVRFRLAANDNGFLVAWRFRDQFRNNLNNLHART